LSTRGEREDELLPTLKRVLSTRLKNSKVVPKKEDIIEPVLTNVLFASSTCQRIIRSIESQLPKTTYEVEQWS
jgi:hypothetical protein